MRLLKRGFVAAFLLLFTPLAAALDMTARLTTFFAHRLTGFSDEVVVNIVTPARSLPTCQQPVFSVSNNTKLWGNLSVLVRCASEKRYLRVTVQATGNYVVAVAPIARGNPLRAENITLTRGRLDQLPPGAMLDINQALNAISLRDLAPGQPIQLNMVRKVWRVKAGERVQVIVGNKDFSVNAEGQALNNAAIAQSARVRMPSGHVVKGTVDANGNILINLSSL